MSQPLINVGGTTAGSRNSEDEEDDFLRKNASSSLIQRVESSDKLTDLLQYLLDKKPAEFSFGREHYLNSKELEECVSGLSLKLKIHGYDDRGERLKYLFSILSKKYIEKQETFKILIKFLIDMSQRPTAVTHLELSSEQYSPDPDDDSNIDEDSERQKALLKLILSESDNEDHQTELQYSSDSELSEWSDDEESESIEEKSGNDIPPIKLLRHSSSFGEFSDVVSSAHDSGILKQQIQSYWTEENLKATSFLQHEVRKFNAEPLRSQPVISSLLVLQARFGEFWEWKKLSKSSENKDELLVVFEEDVVREILWQFTIANPIASPVFCSDWNVKPNIMVATLSQATFSSCVSKFGNALRQLQTLREFAKTVELLSTKDSNENKPAPSKMYRSYAYGLREIFLYVTKCISKLERELKRNCRSVYDKTEPACTTLILLVRQTRDIVDLIYLLYKVHSTSIPDGVNDCSYEPWLSSVRLISCLEAELSNQTKPSMYGVLVFLFSKCFHVLLDDVLSTLRTLKWDEKYSLFIRNPVHLNDSNFWSDCIKIQNYQEKLKSFGVTPLTCLDKFLPKVLNILKTCEVLYQLEEDTKVLGKANFDVRDVVQEYLDEIFQKSSSTVHSDSKCGEMENVDYMTHYNYLGLGSSLAANSFRFLTCSNYSPTINAKKSAYVFDDFVHLQSIPIISHTITFQQVLSKWFNPFCITAKDNIQKIFQDYKVLESITVFQEIILAVREDFARAIVEIASNQHASEEYKYEDLLNRNRKYQKLLSECYPEGRQSFTVDLKLDSTNDMNCTFLVTPHFPLNLIVTPKSVAGYLFIGRQLHRIRKSLWDVSSLNAKDCMPSEGVPVTRMRAFRFCLINFCSSIRSFFTLKLFSKDFSEYAKSASYEDDLDCIRRIHQDYLETIETRMLRHPIIEGVIIRKIVVMSEVLRKRWCTGIASARMLVLEDTLKKCWQVVNDFQSSKHSFDFNELSFHFGPPPSFL